MISCELSLPCRHGHLTLTQVLRFLFRLLLVLLWLLLAVLRLLLSILWTPIWGVQAGATLPGKILNGEVALLGLLVASPPRHVSIRLGWLPVDWLSGLTRIRRRPGAL